MDKKQFWNDLKSGLFSSMVKESSKGQHLFSPKDVFNVMKPIFAEKDDIERLYDIFLNTKNRIIVIEKIIEKIVRLDNHAFNDVSTRNRNTGYTRFIISTHSIFLNL